MSVPTVDARLAEWSTQFQSIGTAAPADFSLTAAQMTQYTTLHDAWMSAYNACKAEGARSKALVQGKQDAKGPLLFYARQLYGMIQANAAVTNENKTLIGVKVRDNLPSPVPPPALAPLISVLSVTGRIVRYKLADATAPTSRRRPPNALGALILSFTGEDPPNSSDTRWRIQGQTGKTTFVIQFPDDVAPGTKCWASAIWYSRRGGYSPAADPIQVYLQIGPVTESA